MADVDITTGAVCVYPNRVKDCVQLLKKQVVTPNKLFDLIYVSKMG